MLATTLTRSLNATDDCINRYCEQENGTFDDFSYVCPLTAKSKTIFQATDNERAQHDRPDRPFATKETYPSNDGCCDCIKKKCWINCTCYCIAI